MAKDYEGGRIAHVRKGARNRPTYHRPGHHNIDGNGYMEEGTTNTPLAMRVTHDLDRFHFVADVVHRVPRLASRQGIREKHIQHNEYIARYGDDMPDDKGRIWAQASTVQRAGSAEADADNV